MSRSIAPDFLGVNGEDIQSHRELWTQPGFLAAVRSLDPGTVRLFGGTTSNFWDWRAGTFVADGQAVPLPSWIGAARTSSPPLRLSDVAGIVDAVGTKPLWVLNMVTATLDDQVAMLHRAAALGLPVDRVELGNELYSSDPAYTAVFPTAASYALTAAAWADRLHSEFPGVRVAVDLASSLVSGGDARRQDWNEVVLGIRRHVDAVTLHEYFDSAITGRAGITDAADGQRVIGSADSQFGILTKDLRDLPRSLEVWVTEWNLLDHDSPISGTWAHGLVVATYALRMIGRPQLTVASYHSLVGNAVAAAIFGGPTALDYDGTRDPQPFVGPAAPPATTTFGRSAAGVALADVLAASRGATHVDVPPLPAVTASCPVLAAVFRTATGTRRILLVNDGSAGRNVTLPTTPGHWVGAAHADDPARYVTGESSVPRRQLAVRSVVDLPAYSVTELVESP